MCRIYLYYRFSSRNRYSIFYIFEVPAAYRCFLLDTGKIVAIHDRSDRFSISGTNILGINRNFTVFFFEEILTPSKPQKAEKIDSVKLEKIELEVIGADSVQHSSWCSLSKAGSIGKNLYLIMVIIVYQFR